MAPEQGNIQRLVATCRGSLCQIPLTFNHLSSISSAQTHESGSESELILITIAQSRNSSGATNDEEDMNAYSQVR